MADHNTRLRRLAVALLVTGLLMGASHLHANLQSPEDAILAKGFAAFMDGRDKTALSHFEEVIRINPSNTAAKKGIRQTRVRLKREESVERAKQRKLAVAKRNEARAFLRSQDLVGAIDALHAALDAWPEMPAARRDVARIHKNMERQVSQRQFNAAQWAFARGVLAYLDRDWARAYRIWSERAAIDPANVGLVNASARAERKFGEMMIAEREEFYRRGARAHYEQGLHHQAKASWEQVLALRDDDIEALAGIARSEEAILSASGHGRDMRAHALLERGLEQYASQRWQQALETFRNLVTIAPDFATAKEYIARIQNRMAEVAYHPARVTGSEGLWRETRPSNVGAVRVEMPDTLDNYDARRAELESQLNRDPGNIRIQQELDRVVRAQDEESERIYKDGLIAYSQGNRSLAIHKWRQVLVINGEHRKAESALKKALAEEERYAGEGGWE